MTSTQITRYFLVVLLSVFTLVVSRTPVGAHAQTAPATSYSFTVNNTNDTHDAQPGDGICADSMGQCSLRAAIEEADALPSGSSITITLPTGTYPLTLGTLGLTTNTITINGAGSTSTTISGNKKFEIIFVSSSANASLNGLTIDGGKARHGGGITNHGMLSMSSSTVSNNTASEGGGGIWNNHGTLSLSNNSAVSANTAILGGGGIKNDGGTLSMSSSTVSANTAGHYGGGIFVGAGTVSVINSTISNNTAGTLSLGGGIFNFAGAVSVESSTISNNTALVGGGIANGKDNLISTATLTVTNSTIINNSTTYNDGGGIYNCRMLTVTNSTISGNSAANGNSGGGISNESGGTLTVTNSTFSNNFAGQGGGINNGTLFAPGGTLTVTNSTFSNNSGTFNDGGGISNIAGKVSVSNSTFSGNSSFRGGGIYNGLGNFGGTVSVSNSTFSGNSASGNNSDGGGIYNNTNGILSVTSSTFSGNLANNSVIANYGTSATLTGTIVANNQSGSNCFGPITDGGSNLDSGSSCGFHLKSDLNKTNPKLGPLHNNGGPTQTMALLQGSPAIDWVAASSCPASDQRGYVRPDGSGEAMCDIGAYESSY